VLPYPGQRLIGLGYRRPLAFALDKPCGLKEQRSMLLGVHGYCGKDRPDKRVLDVFSCLEDLLSVPRLLVGPGLQP